MKYTYIAVNEKNKKYKSEITANSREEAKRLLQMRGLTALKIDEFVDTAESNKSKNLWERDLNFKDIHDVVIPKKKVLTILHQMSIMMKAGISLSLAMEVMLDTEKDKDMRKILEEMNKDLYNGISLSASMGKFKAFPDLIVNIVQAGELNGRLDLSFQQSSLITEKEVALNAKLKSAMIYPLILITLTIALIIILSVVVIPQFEGVFNTFGAELPAITQMTVSVSDFLINYWYIVIAVAGIIAISWKLAMKYSDSAAMWWAKNQLKIPIVGNVLSVTYVARFCRMLATLTDAGVSIVDSLSIARDVIGNLYMTDCMQQIIEDVKIGTPINVAMSRWPIFDPLLVSMIRIGEESGQLTDSLNKMSELYEDQANEATKRMTDAMTPAMTIVLAVVVGTVVVSIMIPMFGMYDVIAG